jgi:DNA-binding GntR family transcriptional regulator
MPCVERLKQDASFAEILAIEQDFRKAIFTLSNSRYVELIFQINSVFAWQHFRSGAELDETPEHIEFVKAWRSAKLLEIGAVADGDTELASMAAKHARNIWHSRLRFANSTVQADEFTKPPGQSDRML